MTALQIAAVYIGVNTLILFYLSLRVVLQRMKTQTSLGYGDDPILETNARVHGNAAEYIPVVMIGLLACALLSMPIWVIHTLGIGFTLGRVLHAFGFAKGVMPARQLGMVLTWTFMLATAGALFYAAFAL